MQLLESTQELLERTLKAGWSLRAIADASDGSVNRDWLTKFAAGKIDNPGINSIQSLHDCLKSLKTKSAA